MTSTKTTPVYETSDGQEFDDEAAAEQHEKFIEAKDAYEEARKRWTRVLAESQTTADGHPFEFSVERDYWFITCWVNVMPTLQSVSFITWNCDINDNDEGSIRQLWENERGEETWYHYKISELYLSKAKATKVLIVAQKEHIAELRTQLNETIKTNHIRKT